MAFALFSEFGYTRQMAGKTLKKTRFVYPFASILAGAAATLFLFFSTAWSAEEARLMERWLVSDELSERNVDHSAWQAFLDRYRMETPQGVVLDYGAVSGEDRARLGGYLLSLRRTDVDRLNRNEQMAFWINAYNALIVWAILSEYPVGSINDVGGGWFSSGPGGDKRFRVYQIDLTLNDIYHRILRPIWADNRVHYVIACGARGCPDLPAKAFTGTDLNQDLEAAAVNFVNGPKAILQINGPGVRLSRIYDWYRKDFGNTPEAVIAHLRSFAGPELTRRLLPINTINGHAFDWSLNDAGENR